MMTAHMPPPTVVVQDRELSFSGQLTQATATRHVIDIQTTLKSLEQAVADMPAGELKSRLQYRVLRLHNQLSRGGQALNDHFQTAQVSPDSAGGDKEPTGSDQQTVQGA